MCGVHQSAHRSRKYRTTRRKTSRPTQRVIICESCASRSSCPRLKLGRNDILRYFQSGRKCGPKIAQSCGWLSQILFCNHFVELNPCFWPIYINYLSVNRKFTSDECKDAGSSWSISSHLRAICQELAWRGPCRTQSCSWRPFCGRRNRTSLIICRS